MAHGPIPTEQEVREAAAIVVEAGERMLARMAEKYDVVSEAEQRVALMVDELGQEKLRELAAGHRLIETMEQRKREGRVRILRSAPISPTQ